MSPEENVVAPFDVVVVGWLIDLDVLTDTVNECTAEDELSVVTRLVEESEGASGL